MELSEVDVLKAEPLISQAKVLLCQLEVTPSVTLAALKLAKKHGGWRVVFVILPYGRCVPGMSVVGNHCNLAQTETAYQEN